MQAETAKSGPYSKATVVLEVSTDNGAGYVGSEKRTALLMERVGNLLAAAREQGVKLKTVVYKPSY